MPTRPINGSEAVMGATKAALVNQGDDLVASEISARAAYGRADRDRRSKQRGFTFVDEKQNEVVNPHAAEIDGDDPIAHPQTGAIRRAAGKYVLQKHPAVDFDRVGTDTLALCGVVFDEIGGPIAK